MIHFEQPSFLLLGILLGAWVWFRSRGSHASRALRILAAMILAAGLALPYWRHGESPIHLIIVADRSPSMPPDSLLRLREWLSSSALKPRSADEIALIGFANSARTEIRSKGTWPGFQEWQQAVSAERTDLGNALDLAASQLEGKPGARVLLISDGLDQGGRVAAAASRLAALGIPVHTRAHTRPLSDEVAVGELTGPARVRVGQPFILGARVQATAAARVPFVLKRGKTVIAQGARDVRPGPNVWRFRDVLQQPSLEEYRLELQPPQDEFRENNTGLLLVRAARQKEAIIFTQRGEVGQLARDLDALGFDIEVRSSQQPPQSAAELAGTRLVVLENVAATDFGVNGLEALRLYVERLGGALLVTGGRSSYGVGGYHHSPLDETLPVSMEVRKEQRKGSVAVCFVLDRSGSMSVEVSPGVQKMQLADEGTVAALQLLTFSDLVSVIAVDSAPHVMVPLQPLTNTGAIASQVRRIRSEGGGIFVRTGLEAAMKELERSRVQSRHIILFSDAADSEEQEGVPALITKLKSIGITVSVIGLGTPQDSDARFLEGVARQSGGQYEITNNPRALPQIFAKQTITILRSTFIDEPVEAATGPDLARLGPAPGTSWPKPGGYNVTYLRPGAGLALKARDDQQSPLLAFWTRGRGRVATLMLPWEGECSGEWPNWSSRNDLLGQIVTWLTASRESDAAQLRWDHSKERPLLRLTLAESSVILAPEPRRLSLLGPGGESHPTGGFQQESATEWIARPEMLQAGHYVAALELNDRDQAISPPLSVPYPPEFQPSSREGARAGKRLLSQVMTRTGRTSPARIADLLEERPIAPESRTKSWPWWTVALLIYLFEIAAERFGWLRGVTFRMPSISFAGWRRAATRAPEPLPEYRPSPKPSTKEAEARPEEEPAPPKRSALQEAKEKARRHLDK